MSIYSTTHALRSSRWVMLALLFFARLMQGLQVQSAASVAPFMIADLGIDYAQVGTLIGLYTVAGVVLALPIAIAGMRLGNARIVTFGLMFMTLGGLVGGVARDYQMAAAGRLIAGVGGLVLSVVTTRMVAERFSGRELAAALAFLLGGWPIALGFGLISQTAIAESTSWRMVFHATAAGSLLAAVLLALFYSAPVRSSSAPMRSVAPLRAVTLAASWRQISRRELLQVTIAGIIWAAYNLAFIVAFSFAPSLLIEQGLAPVDASLLGSVSAWVYIVSMPLGGVIAGRLRRPEHLTVLSLVAMAGAIGALPGTAHPFVLFALLGLFVGLPTGVLMALSIQVLKPENLDFGLGVFYFWLYALFTVLPSAAGAAADLTGNPAAALYFGAGLAVAALLLLFALLALQRAPLRGAENVQECLNVDSHE